MRIFSLLFVFTAACSLYSDETPPDAAAPEAPSCEGRRPLPICANVCSGEWQCPSLEDPDICVCNEIYRYPPECVERYPL